MGIGRAVMGVFLNENCQCDTDFLFRRRVNILEKVGHLRVKALDVDVAGLLCAHGVLFCSQSMCLVDVTKYLNEPKGGEGVLALIRYLLSLITRRDPSREDPHS